jgi:protoporphyrinogen oxidase
MDPVIIVGAGMAGLSCARHLHRAGCPFLLLDGAGHVGGRVRTERTEDGFLLDYGFQVLLSAYPEVVADVDLKALSARPFRSGAKIRVAEGDEIFLRDPLSDWRSLPSALRSPFGTLRDKVRIARLIAAVLLHSSNALLSGAAGSTMDFLREQGFTKQCIDRFFIPFFGGVFLDRTLSVDRRFFQFVFRQFVMGQAVLPMGGMQTVPEYLAANFPKTAVRLSTVVTEVQKHAVRLECGEKISGSAVVLAVDGEAAGRLFPEFKGVREWRQTTCLYFATSDNPAKGDGYLRLNAVPGAIVHNVCFPSDVCPKYAPEGQTLVSVSVHGKHDLSERELLERVLFELTEWFGANVPEWRHLRTFVIPFALPCGAIARSRVHDHNGVFVCGDHVAYPSLNAAMETGRMVAQKILRS